MTLAGCGSKYSTVEAEEQKRQQPDPADQPTESRWDNDSDHGLGDGLMLYRQGNLDAAQLFFEEVVAGNHVHWLAHYYLGLVHCKNKSYGQAIAQLHLSLDQAPRDNRSRALIYVALGECFERNGESGRAEQHYRTALNLHPQSSPAQDGLERLRALTQVDR